MMVNISKKIDQNGVKNFYLFYGQENYLMSYYANEMKKKFISQDFVDMNFDVFSSDIDVSKIINCTKSLPFMSEYRLILIKNSGWFETGKKDDVELFLENINDFCDNAIIIFLEEKIDKRNKLYKKIMDIGFVLEVKSPSRKELIKWIIKICRASQKTITVENAELILKNISSDMYFIKNELEKLISYKKDFLEIAQSDINLLCSQNIETKIFDLIFHMGNKNLQAALEDYNNLIFLKEQPFMILFMIARQFIFILQAKIFSESEKDINSIANLLSTRSFVIINCLKQAKNFSRDILISGIKECRNLDFKIKTGQILLDKLAVENLIIKYTI